MRRVVCARIQDTGEFDVVATTPNEKDIQASTPGCPLVAILPHLQGESFDIFFNALVENGIIQFEHGHPTFAEMPGPCPFAQTQHKTQPLEGEQP